MNLLDWNDCLPFVMDHLIQWTQARRARRSDWRAERAMKWIMNATKKVICYSTTHNRPHNTSVYGLFIPWTINHNQNRGEERECWPMWTLRNPGGDANERFRGIKKSKMLLLKSKEPLICFSKATSFKTYNLVGRRTITKHCNNPKPNRAPNKRGTKPAQQHEKPDQQCITLVLEASGTKAWSHLASLVAGRLTGRRQVAPPEPSHISCLYADRDPFVETYSARLRGISSSSHLAIFLTHRDA